MNQIHKHYSTWIITAIGMLAATEEYLPMLSHYVPEGTIPVLAVLAILAKLYKQQNLNQKD